MKLTIKGSRSQFRWCKLDIGKWQLEFYNSRGQSECVPHSLRNPAHHYTYSKDQAAFDHNLMRALVDAATHSH